jgi:hypothetical protein
VLNVFPFTISQVTSERSKVTKTAGQVICFGLEKIGGKREIEDLRGSFIIPARHLFTSIECDGPLIKDSRDSVTAPILSQSCPNQSGWFVLHQGKMNRDAIH